MSKDARQSVNIDKSQVEAIKALPEYSTLRNLSGMVRLLIEEALNSRTKEDLLTHSQIVRAAWKLGRVRVIAIFFDLAKSLLLQRWTPTNEEEIALLEPEINCLSEPGAGVNPAEELLRLAIANTKPSRALIGRLSESMDIDAREIYQLLERMQINGVTNGHQ
jgi:hypothetical protein